MTETFRPQTNTEDFTKGYESEKIVFSNKSKSLPKFSNYKRFHIENKSVPNKKGTPYPFIPKVKKFGLLKLLLTEIIEFNFKLIKKKYRKRLLARPCIYGVFSGKFGGFRPIKEKCVGCLRCVQEFHEFCTVDRNPSFLDYADSYWAPDSKSSLASLLTPFSNVWYESATGKILVKGMGYKGSFSDSGWDTIWTDMSEIVRPTRDGVYGREFISTTVEIGRKDVVTNLNNKNRLDYIKEIAIPIIFDFLPDNLNNKNIADSIIKAANKVRTICLFSPDQFKKYSLPSLPNYNIGLYLNRELDANSLEMIKNASYIEIEHNLNFNILEIKQLNPNAPVIVRIPVDKNVDELSASLADSHIDGIHLYADYHGKSYDKTDSKFIIEYIRSVHIKLVERGIRNQISIIASGGIISAEHVPKAIICGADLVGIDTTTLVALQTKIIGECTTKSSGIIKQEKFNVNWGSQRLTNLFASWYNQLIEILSAMGIRDVRRLRGEIGRAIFKADIEKEAFNNIEGFGE